MVCLWEWLYRECTDTPDVHIKHMQKFLLLFYGNKLCTLLKMVSKAVRKCKLLQQDIILGNSNLFIKICCLHL